MGMQARSEAADVRASSPLALFALPSPPTLPHVPSPPCCRLVSHHDIHGKVRQAHIAQRRKADNLGMRKRKRRLVSSNSCRTISLTQTEGTAALPLTACLPHQAKSLLLSPFDYISLGICAFRAAAPLC